MLRCGKILLVLFAGFVAGEETPTSKGSLRQLRFSPDGRYVIAQDDSEITVLTVAPFTVLFRISAHKSTAAQFTPDSRNIVFVSSVIGVDPQRIALAKSDAQVERWSVADQMRVESATLPMLVCGTEELSPDGAVLACVDLKSTLRFVDVASGRTIFEKKEFTWFFRYDPPLESVLPVRKWGELGSASIDFSPDGSYVIVSPKNADGSDIAWNVRERRIIELTGRLRQIKRHTPAFIGPDRIVMWNGVASKEESSHGVAKGKVIAFPSGKLLSEPKIPFGLFLFRATDPGFVIVRPFGKRLHSFVKATSSLWGGLPQIAPRQRNSLPGS